MSKPKTRPRDLLTPLTPEDALAGLFDSDGWPDVMPNPDEAAEIICQWLRDSGFAIVDAEKQK
jgi:hypothetical protein